LQRTALRAAAEPHVGHETPHYGRIQLETPMKARPGRNLIAAAFFAAVALTTANSSAQEAGGGAQAVGPYKDFKGTIKLDVRHSVPDWGPFTPKKAPAGAPNILFVLYDDTGLAAWSPYGGRINMPTLDRLAKNGLTYTQWHTR
jgi:arylsulfatase